MSTATIEVVTKVCTKCGDTKVLEEFHKHKSCKDGHAASCKACKAEQDRAWHEANRDAILERKREYRATNAEKVLEQELEYREANRETLAECRRAYYGRNREKELERERKYRAANPHVRWASAYRARARAYGLEPIVEEFTRADVVARWGDRCTYCETGAFEQLDHHVPVSKGGPHTLENARPSCSSCNLAKRDADPVEWAARQAELDEMSDADLEAEIDAEVARWTS